jgi:hypothetical protein
MTNYFVKFPLPEGIANEAVDCAMQIKSATDKSLHHKRLTQVINVLIEHGLTYFFISPVKEGNFGLVVRNLVTITIHGTQKTAIAIVAKVIKNLNNEQTEYLADFIIGIMGKSETLDEK